MKHLKIDFDWYVWNRREDPLLPLHLNFVIARLDFASVRKKVAINLLARSFLQIDLSLLYVLYIVQI